MNDNNDDDKDKRYQQFEIREGIAFVIEVTPEIFSPLSELGGKSILYEILSSINDLMSELVITMKSSGVGIYLYNCDGPLKSMKIPGFQKLFRLNHINLTNMKILNDMIDDDLQGVRSLEHFIKYKQPTETEILPSVLSKVLDELMDKKYFNRKKVVWLTSNDRPYTKASTKENLWRIINDYYNYGYFILPIFLSKDKFNMSLYQDIFLNTNYLTGNKEESEPKAPSGYRGFSKQSSVFKTTLNNQIRSNIFRVKEIRRIQFTCDLILSDGSEGKNIGAQLGCTIKGYTFYSQEKFKRDLLLYTKDETLKRVFTESAIITDGTGEKIPSKEEVDVRKGFNLAGGETLFLDQKQQDFLSNYAFDHEPKDVNPSVKTEETDEVEEESLAPSFQLPPYLKLLGFRNHNTFQPSYNSGPPVFVTPDLGNGLRSSTTLGGYENSFGTFSSLYQSCVKLKKYAVLFGSPKKSSRPSLFALYPTRITNSSRNLPDIPQEFPEGFLLIRLPWLDDIRSLPNYFINDASNRFDENRSLPASLVNTYKELLSQFFYKSYNPRDFNNPSLNFFYKVIKHDLLQISLPDSDKALIKNDITSLKLGELRQFLSGDSVRRGLIEKLNSQLKELEAELPSRVEAFVSSKRQKVDAPELDEDAVLTAWKNDQWNHFTVAQLKKFQTKYKDKIKSATKKQDIIDNISKYLEEQANS